MSVKEQLINDIEMLPENILIEISSIVKKHISFNKNQTNDIGEKRRAMFGCMKGKMWVADDFDAPLEELKEYME